MRKWWKKAGVIAGGLISLGSLASDLQAQGFGSCPPGGCGGTIFSGPQSPMGIMTSGPQEPTTGAPPVSLPNDGSPNAWTDRQNWPQGMEWPTVWFGSEAVIGITKRAPLNVPLATTSTTPNPTSNVGAIGESGTQIVAGFGGIDLRNPSGTRLTLGVCPTPEWLLPIEVIYLYLHERTTVLSDSSDATGNPLLARPILGTQPGSGTTETVYLASFPGLAAGGINIQSSMLLWGLQVQGVWRTQLQWQDECDSLAISIPMGFRYLNLEDTINITNSSAPTTPIFALPFLGTNLGPGNRVVVTDVFKGSNEFRGGELGVRFDARWDKWFMTVEPRISIGSTNENVIINGVSSFNPAGGAAVTTPGGILAVATNGGSHSQERFTYLPEGNLTLGWDCLSWLRLQVGYNIAYWPDVVRAGDQINRTVDVRQVPTDLSYTPGATNLTGPFVTPKESSFLIQGVSVGIVLSY